MNELKEITFIERKTGEGRGYFRPKESRSQLNETNIGGVFRGNVKDEIEREYELEIEAEIIEVIENHVLYKAKILRLSNVDEKNYVVGEIIKVKSSNDSMFTYTES